MKKEKDRFLNHTSNNIYQPIPVRDGGTELAEGDNRAIVDGTKHTGFLIKMNPTGETISLKLAGNVLLPQYYPIVKIKSDKYNCLASQLIEEIKLTLNKKSVGYIMIDKHLDCDMRIYLTCIRTTKEMSNYNMNPIREHQQFEIIDKIINAVEMFNREDNGEEQMVYNPSDETCQLGTSDVSETSDPSDQSEVNCQLGTSESTEQSLNKEE